MRGAVRSWCLASSLLLFSIPAASPALAQATGSVLGEVVETGTGRPLAGASVTITGTTLSTRTDDEGRFVLGGVPAGERVLHVEMIGHRTVDVDRVVVRAGGRTSLRITMDLAPVAIEGVRVDATRIRIIEPDVSVSHDVLPGRELRALPIDRVDEAIELTPGVSGGHFRGGRIGQEVHVIDGIELKNQLESSSQGFALELSPSSLEEIEVVTGGFGAQYGSALSGVVNYTTRRGSTERWDGRVLAQTDQWAPSPLFHGFTGLSASAGGPLRFLGAGATLFVDLLAQGFVDADPRAHGLSCLGELDDQGVLQTMIEQVRTTAPELHCPYTGEELPNQRGDKLIAFARFDRPLNDNARFALTLLRNRNQREFYTPEFRYHPTAQLGQSTNGTLATAAIDWNRQGIGNAWHVVARTGFTRLDRYLGALDPWTFDGRTRVAGFGLQSFRFLGEEFTRSPINEQLASAQAVPGHAEPTGSAGTPFGAAGEGLFFTSGTPHIANWARSDLLNADLLAEYFTANGASLRGGVSGKLFGIENYERIASYLAGSIPTYARFYPAIASGFTEARFGATDEITVNVGVRVDAFRSGISFSEDRGNFLAPVIDPSWKVSVMPRLGLAMPIPGTNERTSMRFNYSFVSQPPDFRYFLDSSIGDSLRTDIQRQGNPQLSFERGQTYEASFSHLLSDDVGGSVTYFYKRLRNLVTGNASIGETGNGQFTTGDFGTVQGVEVTLRGRLGPVVTRGGYALQKAVGVSSGASNDPLAPEGAARTEYPLAFDRRHSLDVALLYGRPAGDAESPWAAVATTTMQSGYPIDRIVAGGGGGATQLESVYLPWTSTIDVRVSRELGKVPVCGTCAWRIMAEARNLLDSENIIALRRETGTLAPSVESVNAVIDAIPLPAASIPRESPAYSPLADFDRDGVITPAEFRIARTAAVLDRYDPSLYYGEARQVRLGLEVTF